MSVRRARERGDRPARLHAARQVRAGRDGLEERGAGQRIGVPAVGLHGEQFGESDIAGEQALCHLDEPMRGGQPLRVRLVPLCHHRSGRGGRGDEGQGDGQPAGAEPAGVPVGLAQGRGELHVAGLGRPGDVEPVRLGRHEPQSPAARCEQLGVHVAYLEEALPAVERAGHRGPWPQPVEDAAKPGHAGPTGRRMP